MSETVSWFTAVFCRPYRCWELVTGQKPHQSDTEQAAAGAPAQQEMVGMMTDKDDAGEFDDAGEWTDEEAGFADSSRPTARAKGGAGAGTSSTNGNGTTPHGDGTGGRGGNRNTPEPKPIKKKPEEDLFGGGDRDFGREPRRDCEPRLDCTSVNVLWPCATWPCGV